MYRILTPLLLLLVASCTHSPPVDRTTTETQTQLCQSPVFAIDANFPAAGMASCNVVNDKTISIQITPEDSPPINPSPWYSVRLTPKKPGPVRVLLEYVTHPHRYKPKVSYDGVGWNVIPDTQIDVKNAGYTVYIDLDLDDRPIFLSGQEIFTNAAHADWAKVQAKKSFVRMSQIGKSIEGRSINMLKTDASVDAPKTVMLVGRQHPPEVTGAIAMVHFAAEILGDTELARKFRANFDLIIIPNLNPDGVEHGHWRHNMAGVDLNRDWGPFTQPETQAAKSVIDQIKEPGLALFLDFHSTRKNIFYTQPIGNDGTEFGFTAEWLKRARSQLPGYVFGRKGAHNVNLPTSKTFIFQEFGIPAITYELGDETDRKDIAESARVFAREMMILLLEQA